ncbi:MAG: TonB-dependent receptor, partial [Bacteroidetes bacterium]
MKQRLLIIMLVIVWGSLTSYGQDITISGQLTDKTDGTPLIGANVLVKGTTVGAVTDTEGNYRLSVPDGATHLTISYIGYSSIEIEIGARSVINLALAQDLTRLDEIVVVGYGTVKKKDLTGAVVSLGEKDMTIGAATNSISSMIQGRAAGVEVSANDGLPGQSLNIVIRGNNTISNSNEPLYVIDGFPIAAGVSIAPED